MNPSCLDPPSATPAAPRCVCEPVAERLRRAGAEALCDSELLALLLTDAGEPDVATADQLLSSVGGLCGLAVQATPAPPPRLVALRELAVRFHRPQLEHSPALYCPADVVQYLVLRYARTAQEVCGVLYLDAQHNILAEREMFRGSRYQVTVEPALILREALLVVAAGVLVFHTHPGGSKIPSAADVSLTQRLHEACELVGVRLVDSLIIGSPGNWCSLRQSGLF